MDKAVCHWKDVLIRIDTPIITAIQLLDAKSLRVLLVVDENQRLLGIITDGDIRRYLLKHAPLEATVDKIMNKNPVFANISESQEQILMRMHALNILHIPIVDGRNQVIGLETYESFFEKRTRDNWIILMAGGVGKRLRPLTLDCPKPLIKIGNKPIAEILLENLIKSGFKNYIFSLNYKSEMIRDYFGTGERWGINISYIQEVEELGTAGSLSLLPFLEHKPFFVINADILTNINFGHVLDFHQEKKDKTIATICVRQHQSKIPFGLVHIDEMDSRLIDIEEKPIKNYFVNGGIYILEPEILRHLNFNTYCDMPHLLNHLVKKGFHVATFPIHEYWLDIGHHDNLLKAASDYLEVFS
ncbi:MAG: CBS domain-containing protein [Gammaproteobacteria bacterium]|nr:CBS domain-containing protein [Gammaproteobacteria bacterium]